MQKVITLKAVYFNNKTFRGQSGRYFYFLLHNNLNIVKVNDVLKTKIL